MTKDTVEDQFARIKHFVREGGNLTWDVPIRLGEDEETTNEVLRVIATAAENKMIHAYFSNMSKEETMNFLDYAFEVYNDNNSI